MDDSNKFLKIIFAVLLIITAAELYYFFFYQPTTTNNIVKKTLTTKPTTSPESQAIGTDTINNLSRYKKSILSSSIVSNKHEGKIVLIDDKGGFLKTEQFKYSLEIKIESNLNEFNSFFYSEKEIQQIKVFSLKNEQKEPIDISKLKIGDSIIIEESLNLLKEPIDNLKKLEISVL